MSNHFFFKHAKMTNHIMCVILFTYVTNNQNWTWSDEEKRLGNKQFPAVWCTCDHIGSTHFQVSKAELEIFHSNHCSMHFAQYFLDRHMFHFFMPVWKHCLVSANQKQAAIFQQWRSPYHIYIYQSKTILPSSLPQSYPWLLDSSFMRTATTGAQLTKATSPLPMNGSYRWACV